MLKQDRHDIFHYFRYCDAVSGLGRRGWGEDVQIMSPVTSILSKGEEVLVGVVLYPSFLPFTKGRNYPSLAKRGDLPARSPALRDEGRGEIF